MRRVLYKRLTHFQRALAIVGMFDAAKGFAELWMEWHTPNDVARDLAQGWDVDRVFEFYRDKAGNFQIRVSDKFRNLFETGQALGTVAETVNFLGLGPDCIPGPPKG